MSSNYPREGLHWVKVARFLALPFRPARLKTWRFVRRFEDIDIEDLVANGVQGVLLDADGTLGPHHARAFPEPVARHVRAMLDRGLRVAIYTNAGEDRFEQFPGVAVVGNVPPKPSVQGFLIAMRDYLHLDDPATVCMIGDNFITDGGAIDAGMRFIHVRPVPGNENPVHRLARHFAYLLARWHAARSQRP